MKAIPYIGKISLTGIAIIIIQSPDYVTNFLFAFYLLVIAAISLSLIGLRTGCLLGLPIIIFIFTLKGNLIGFDKRAAAITFVFFVLVFTIFSSKLELLNVY